jgi:hypothetical protein
MMDLSRLGREQFETGYVLKRLLQGGVRVWCYLGGREVTAQNWVERAIISIRGGADEAAREDASLRVSKDFYDRVRKGHVTGGRVFGYRNLEIAANGKRSHVVREVEPTEAEVVRRIFSLTEEGRTDREVLATLTEEHAPAPVPRGGGKVQGWTLAAVRAIRRNPLYRGEVVYGRRKVRDEWGQKKIQVRDSREWVRNNDESLRIVPEDLWATVQALLDTRSQTYRKARAQGGRPVAAQESKHLLGGVLSCGLCGGSLIVRDHGRGRPHYFCWSRHQRGPTACAGISIPIAVADDAVRAALYERIMTDSFLTGIIERATTALLEDHSATVRPNGTFTLPELEDPAQQSLREKIAHVEAKIRNLTDAIEAGGDVRELVARLKERKADLATLQAQAQRQSPKPTRSRAPVIQIEDLKDAIAATLFSPEFQKAALKTLLTKRITFRPTQDGTYEFEGQGDLMPLLSGQLSVRAKENPRGASSPVARSVRLKPLKMLRGFETPRDGGA